MHELSIAQAMVEAACEHADAYNPARIKRMVCEIGRLRHVDDWMLREAFAIAKADTPAVDAALEVTYIGTHLSCRACGAEEVLDSWRFDCPGCGSNDIELTGGDQLQLTSIELEVPDDHPGAQEEPL